METDVFGCNLPEFLNEEVKLRLFLYFLQNMEDMEKSHEGFLQGAQQELRKEMATLQKKILMDTVSAESQTQPSDLQRGCNGSIWQSVVFEIKSDNVRLTDTDRSGETGSLQNTSQRLH